MRITLLARELFAKKAFSISAGCLDSHVVHVKQFHSALCLSLEVDLQVHRPLLTSWAESEGVWRPSSGERASGFLRIRLRVAGSMLLFRRPCVARAFSAGRPCAAWGAARAFCLAPSDGRPALSATRFALLTQRCLPSPSQLEFLYRVLPKGRKARPYL